MNVKTNLFVIFKKKNTTKEKPKLALNETKKDNTNKNPCHANEKKNNKR